MSNSSEPTPPVTDRDIKPVAVVGMACCFPGCPDLPAFWRRLLSAEPAIGEPLKGVSETAHGSSAGEKDIGLLREVIQEALDDAERGNRQGGGAHVPGAGGPVAAIAGPPGLLEGPSARAVHLFAPLHSDGAGSTSALQAVLEIAEILRAGEVRLGIAAAIEPSPARSFPGQSPGRSPSGAVRSYADDADGWQPGCGAGAVVLKLVEEAKRDGDRIYALIRGVTKGDDEVDVPSCRGLLAALQRMYGTERGESVGVSLVEGVGAAVPGEDAAEAALLREFFGGDGWPAVSLGSVASLIGYAGRAAGMAGLIKAALALYHRALPPTASLERALPLLAEGRLLPNTTLRPWISPPDQPRRAGVDEVSDDGRTAHALLEEGPEDQDAELLTPYPAELILLSGPSKAALAERLRTIQPMIPQLSFRDLADLACTQLGYFRETDAVRMAIVVADPDDLGGKLAMALERLDRMDGDTWIDPDGIYFGSGAHEGKVALLYGGIAFPGLTSGATTRFGELCIHFPMVRRAMDVADGETLRDSDPPYPLRHQFFPPAALDSVSLNAIEKELALSARTLTGMFLSYVAAWDLLKALDLRPDVMTGFSLGEWGALYASGALDLADLISLRRRADEMEDAPPDQDGLWAMVGAPASRIEPILKELSGSVSITVDISPENVFIGGGVEDVQEAVARLTREGIWVQELNILLTNPIHTPVLLPWVKKIREMLENLPVSNPGVPVICGMTGAPYPEEPDAVRDLLSEVPLRHVRIQDTIQSLHARGVRTFVQAGMGGRLPTVIHSTLKLEPHTALSMDDMQRGGLEHLLHFIGRLAALGIHHDASLLFKHRRPRRLEIPLRAVKGHEADRAAEIDPLRNQRGPLKPDRPPPSEPLAPPIPAEGPVTATSTAPYAETVATLQHFLALQAEQEEGDRLVMQAFLDAQEAAMKAMLRVAASRSGGAGRPTVNCQRPFMGEITQLEPGRELRAHLVLDLDEHRFFLDHTLIKIPRGLRPPEECLPTLPMTFGIEILAEAASSLMPHLPINGVQDVQATRWVSFIDARRLDLEVHARVTGPETVAAEVFMEGGQKPVYRGVVTLGPRPSPPAPMGITVERDCPHTGPELYSKNRMFHGPAFQVVHSLQGLSDEGIAGTLLVRDPSELFASPMAGPMVFDPVALDGMGQLVGYRAQVDRLTAYPVHVQRALVYSDAPPPGSLVSAVGRLRATEGRFLIWDIDVLAPSGQVWMRLEGWKIWKFLWTEPARLFYFDTCGRGLGTEWESGLDGALCVRVHRSIFRDLDPERVIRSFLRGEEWERYVQTRSLDTLLGMVAAKDVVRLWLRKTRGISLHPLEVNLSWDPSGAPKVEVPGGPPLALSISHAGEEAIGLLVEGAQGVGCDLVAMAQRDPAFETTALDAKERALLDRLDERERHPWLHRCFAAKEAAVKCFGEGYAALPGFRIRAIRPDEGGVEVECPDGRGRLQVHTVLDADMVIALAAR
ncbi:MAG: acyltransferase domain-containing protein [Acidobacteriota bacterium]